MDKTSNGHNPEWIDTIPNGFNPKWTQFQINIQNRHNPEWALTSALLRDYIGIAW